MSHRHRSAQDASTLLCTSILIIRLRSGAHGVCQSVNLLLTRAQSKDASVAAVPSRILRLRAGIYLMASNMMPSQPSAQDAQVLSDFLFFFCLRFRSALTISCIA